MLNPKRLPKTKITSASFKSCVPIPEPLGPADPAFNGWPYGRESPWPGDIVHGAFNNSANFKTLSAAIVP